MTFEAQPDSHSYHIYLCCCEINNYKHPYAQGKKLRLLSATFACLSPPRDAGDLLGRSGGKGGCWVPPSPAPEQKEQQRQGWEGAEEEGSCRQPSCWPCVNSVKFAQGNSETFAFAFSVQVWERP